MSLSLNTLFHFNLPIELLQKRVGIVEGEGEKIQIIMKINSKFRNSRQWFKFFQEGSGDSFY